MPLIFGVLRAVLALFGALVGASRSWLMDYLLASCSIEEEQLVRSIVGPEVARVDAPVDVLDEGRALGEGADQLHLARLEHIDVCVVATDGELAVVWRELEVLDPLGHRTLLSFAELPVSRIRRIVDAELATPEADGAEASVA